MCSKLAVLRDSELSIECEPGKPRWLFDHDSSVVDAFISQPPCAGSPGTGEFLDLIDDDSQRMGRAM